MKTKTSILLIISVVAVMFSLQLMTPSVAFGISCNTTADCSKSYPYGGQYCKDKSLYQTMVVYSCVNSQCVSNQTATLIQTCNDQCQQGIWYTGCGSGGGTTSGTGTGSGGTTGGTTNQPSNQCYSFSYQKCVANDVYWYDSCNVQGQLAKKCAPDQVCQGGSCYNFANQNYSIVYNTNNTTNNTTNVYTAHFSKGCQNNVVYWYDTAGTKGDVYQNCNYSGQLCSDGKCIVDPNPAPKPAPKPTPAPAPAPTPAPVTSAPTPTCGTGTVLAQACVSQTAFTGGTNGNIADNTTDNSQTPDTTQVAEQPTETNNNTAAVSQTKNNPLMTFLTKWYVWIIIGIVLIVFFIIVFKKSSTEAERKRKRQLA